METFKVLATGGGLTAIGAVVAGLLANWLGARRDKRTHAHERAMAREARQQERLAQTYLELLRHVLYLLDWSRSIRPMIGAPPPPEPMTSEERWRVQALVAMYGSREVQDLLTRLYEQAGKIANVNHLLGKVEAARRPGKQLEQLAAQEEGNLPVYRSLLDETVGQLREQVRRELSGDTDLIKA